MTLQKINLRLGLFLFGGLGALATGRSGFTGTAIACALLATFQHGLFARFQLQAVVVRCRQLLQAALLLCLLQLLDRLRRLRSVALRWLLTVLAVAKSFQLFGLRQEEGEKGPVSGGAEFGDGFKSATADTDF